MTRVIIKQRYLITLVLVLVPLTLLAFIPFGRIANPVAISKTMDVAHVFAFIFFSGLLYLAIEHHGIWRAMMVSALFSMLLMAVIEWVQPYFGRTASWADIQLGLLGMFIALSGMMVWRCIRNRLLKVAYTLLLIITLVWIVEPVWNEWHSLWLRQQQFPMLGDFESKLEKRLWMSNGKHTQVSLSDKHVVSGVSALKVEMNKGVWNGVRYAAGEQDWREYKTLMMTFYNPGVAFSMNVRIDDGVHAYPQYSERYNGRFQIGEGETTLLVPLTKIAAGPKSRSLDLARISKMILFLGRNKKRQLFYLDNVRLMP
ncbi:hypothetical protein MNBD_GAMMA16-1346 [hydrothermal vent metagenome]|uniref:Uncharacterized protein n=1 Tax=hydrothermal vent metagenome TaxID=652676 RepID=A0A3B0YUY2_9ZZZZ